MKKWIFYCGCAFICALTIPLPAATQKYQNKTITIRKSKRVKMTIIKDLWRDSYKNTVVLPLSTVDTFKDPQWMLKTADSNEP